MWFSVDGDCLCWVYCFVKFICDVVFFVVWIMVQGVFIVEMWVQWVFFVWIVYGCFGCEEIFQIKLEFFDEVSQQEIFGCVVIIDLCYDQFLIVQ